MMGDLFGIRPWEMGDLRCGELEACRRYVKELNSRDG